jgi:hypothetical protein
MPTFSQSRFDSQFFRIHLFKDSQIYLSFWIAIEQALVFLMSSDISIILFMAFGEVHPTVCGVFIKAYILLC